MFATAVSLAVSLNHPNVVEVFGASHLSSPFVAVLESAASTSLREYLKQKEHKHEVWQTLFEASLGLQYLLDQGMVLERLRCDDIWVGSDGIAKVFALACFQASNKSKLKLTSSPSQSGDVRWQSPERIRGAPASAESNVFALAMCAVEALTGEVPWGATEDDIDVAQIIPYGWRPALPDGLSREQKVLIEQMWREDPLTRPTISSVSLQLKQQANESVYARSRVQTTGPSQAQDSTPSSVVSLEAFLLPELGSTLCAFLEKLVLKSRHCQASPDDMAHILSRMWDVLRMLESQHRRTTDLVVERFVETLLSVDRFLRVAVSKQSVLLLAKSQKVSLRSRVFHRRLDEVLVLLSPPTLSPIHEWESKSEPEVETNPPSTSSSSGWRSAGSGDDDGSAVPGEPTTAVSTSSSASSGPVKTVRFETNGRSSDRFESESSTADTGADSDVGARLASRAEDVHAEWFIRIYDLKYDRAQIRSASARSARCSRRRGATHRLGSSSWGTRRTRTCTAASSFCTSSACGSRSVIRTCSNSTARATLGSGTLCVRSRAVAVSSSL